MRFLLFILFLFTLSTSVFAKSNGLQWSATKQEYDKQNQTVHLSGKVHIQENQNTLSADEVTIDLTTGDLSASGHCQFTNGSQTVKRTKIRINISDETWAVLN